MNIERQNIERQNPLNDFDGRGPKDLETASAPTSRRRLGMQRACEFLLYLFHGNVYFRTCWVHHLRESNPIFLEPFPPNSHFLFVCVGGGRILSNARTRSRKCTFKKRHKLNSQGSGKTYFFKRVSQTVPKVFDASVDEATADSSPKLATNRSGFKAWPTHPEPS